jgi:hypothetical protein
VKGEALTPPPGRADDFVWPRREVGREPVKGETPMASTSPDGTVAAPNAPPKPKKPRPMRRAVTAPIQDSFGFSAPQQLQPPASRLPAN